LAVEPTRGHNWITVLSSGPSNGADDGRTRRGGAGGHTVLDLDRRLDLQASAREFSRQMALVRPRATVVLGGDAEWEPAGVDPATDGTTVRVVKHGRDGCTVHHTDERVEREPRRPGALGIMRVDWYCFVVLCSLICL
jgi:sugar/nucleoside kinase (ribokinase family)